MKRRNRSKFWVALKWAGVVACVVILGAWMVSTTWILEYLNTNENVFVSACLYAGCLVVARQVYEYPEDRAAKGFDPPALWRKRRITWIRSWREQLGLRMPLAMTRDDVVEGCPWTPYRRTEVVLPLWMPFVLLAIATAYIFARDRRWIPPGHCKTCGYILTGNVSGICSECGTEIVTATAKQA